MFIWMSRLLDISRIFYTENQRECFFRKVDDVFRRCFIQAVWQTLPHEQYVQAEEKINSGEQAEYWWEDIVGTEYDLDGFLHEKVYKSMFDDLEINGYYTDEVMDTAQPEDPEQWFRCATVKSILHELINDEEDPYRISIPLTDRMIAYLSYMVYSVFVNRISRSLRMEKEDTARMLKLMYCGEFAQNDWLNLVWREDVKEIRRKVTERFLYAYLYGENSLGMEPATFSEFIHDELILPVYWAFCDGRKEIMEKSMAYFSENAQNKWTPAEMDRFYRYITENVPLKLEEPHLEWYLPGENAEENDSDDAFPDMIITPDMVEDWDLNELEDEINLTGDLDS